MSRKGFTLIELMVVISIILTLSGMSLAAYFRFSQRQAAMNDARNFSTMLRRVQAMAKNLVYPEGCVGLTSYNLTSDGYDATGDGTGCDGCKSMSASAICSGASIKVIDKETILQKAFFTSPVNIYFSAGSGSINTEAVGTYILTNNKDYTSQIAVTTDQNGVVELEEVVVTTTPKP